MCFTGVILFNLHNIPMWYVLLLVPFYNQGNLGTERLPKVSQLINGRVEIADQAVTPEIPLLLTQPVTGLGRGSRISLLLRR